MQTPLDFLNTVRVEMRASGIRFAITSGMACVHYGLQENPGRERISPLLDDSRAGTKAKSAPVPDFQTRKRLTASRNGPGASACTQCPACGIVSIVAAGNSRMIVSRCSGRR